MPKKKHNKKIVNSGTTSSNRRSNVHTSSNNLEVLSNKSWTILGVLSALLTILLSYYALKPQMTVETPFGADDKKLLLTFFEIKNNSYFNLKIENLFVEIHEVEFGNNNGIKNLNLAGPKINEIINPGGIRDFQLSIDKLFKLKDVHKVELTMHFKYVYLFFTFNRDIEFSTYTDSNGKIIWLKKIP
ncbi:hypothetical protein J2I47_26255 [Fibrella sp. HMF5335]|uniref:Uncharacterized protein n=1 Tax=Fibrella rubiginis TaxID=2817060 RepID=A0A939K8T5_9BACT|nr:hypothetical protein [Fibrella rubiginis]MBO0940075.1 hypothetical protein [Fibrella rubiginis]